MSYWHHYRATLVLGLPLIGSQMAQFAVHVVDTVMLGWYGVEPLAASVLATSFFFVIFIMGSGFAFAVMPMVAEAESSGQQTRVRRVTRMGLWLSVIYAALFLPLMIWSGSVLTYLGQDPDLSMLAQEHLRVVGFGLFPALLIMVLKSYLAALERTSFILWVTVLAIPVNAALNWALIFGNAGLPELGLKGAAVATIIVQIGSLLVLMLYAARAQGLRDHALFQRIWRPDPVAFGEVFRLGWPIGLTNLAESAMFSASALIMGLIGTMELAAHGIALQITSAAFMAHIGLSQASTIRVGRAVGRHDLEGLWRAGMAALVLSMGVVALSMVIFLAMPEPIIAIFLAPDEPARLQIVGIGVALLAVAALFQLVDAGQVMALGMLRGIQDTKVPMYMAAVSYWVLGVPASYVLGVALGFDGVGVWLGLVIGLLAACILLWWRFLVLYRRM